MRARNSRAIADADADGINHIRAQHENLHEGKLLDHDDLPDPIVHRRVADQSQQQKLDDIQQEANKATAAAKNFPEPPIGLRAARFGVSRCGLKLSPTCARLARIAITAIPSSSGAIAPAINRITARSSALVAGPVRGIGKGSGHRAFPAAALLRRRDEAAAE